MSVTGFQHGAHEAMLGQARAIRDQIEQKGHEVVQNFGELTGGDLQGAAADATQGFGQEVQRATNAANQAVMQLEQQTTNFGQNMGNTDAQFAGAIGG